MSSLRITYTDNDNGSIVFGTESIANWQDIESNLTRSKSYRGRVRKVTNTFEFVGVVRNNYIMRNYDKNKTKAQATLLIEVGDDNFDEFSFTPLGSGYSMVADFNSYKVVENKVQLNFVDSDFQQKITAGEKEKLNITTANVLGDKDTLVTDYNTRLKTISMHDRELEFNSELNSTDLFPDNELISVTTFGIDTFALTPKFKSDDNIKQTFQVLSAFDQNNPEIERFFYLKSDKDRSLNMSFEYELYSTLGDAYKISIYRYDDDFNFIDETIIQEGTASTPSQPTGDILDKDIVYEVKEGESLLLYAQSGLGPLFSKRDKNKITFNSLELFPRATSNCILPHEFFTHYIELMTGIKDGFYSTYFGRTDLGYAQDGEGAYIAIMDGHMIRNLPIEENPLNTTFKDVVEDFIKMKNLVAGIRYVGDREVFCIDKYEDFYTTYVIADIGEVFSEPELEINKDLTFSKILVGSKDLELEDLFGLDSPHGEINYSTPLNNTDNELNLVIKGIINDYAIEQLRRKQFSIAPKEDLKNDKKICYVDAKKGATTDVLAKTNEGYTSITGVLSPNKMYNVNLVPSEQVRHWDNVINGCLQAEQDGQLTLTKSASNNTLVREKDSGEVITEKNNIPINTLRTPLIINENIMVNAPLSKSLYDTIESNPNGLYKLTYKGVDFYSYIDLLSYNVSDKIANFTLNRSSR